jgi:hypothetical protein
VSVKPKTEEAPALIEILNDAKTKAWNQSISPKLESLRAWFSGPEWKDGVGNYLRFVTQQQTQNLVRGCKTRDEDQYLRGLIAGLQQVVEMPQAIERQIELIEQNKKQAESRGDAGY